MTDEKKQKIEFENCYVLIVEKKLGNIRDILPFLELGYQEQKPLLIIAEDLESELLTGLILNRLKNNLKICAVKAPSFGDNRKAILQDIAIFTGGKFISEEAGVTLESVTSSPEEIKATLGIAKNITITKDDTIILNGNGSKYIFIYIGLTSITELKSLRSRSLQLRAATIRKSLRKG